ncbi:MAG: IS110 family transposase [bacterium]
MCWTTTGRSFYSREVRGTASKVIEELSKVKEESSEAMSICFEASSDSGHLHDALKGITEHVQVAHPAKLRLIFQCKKKNDQVDARKLATLLFLDQVPPVYVPASEVRNWRQTIEYRVRLVNKRTRVKNEIRSFLRVQGVKAPKKLWSKAGLSWLYSLEFEQEMISTRLSMLLDELKNHEENLRKVEKALGREAKRNAGVQLLMTIPGVGIRTAECLVAYIDDPARFSSSNELAAYFGLVPILDSSAGRDRLGHITKQGPPTARRLLVESSWVAVRRSPTIRAKFERIQKGDPDRNKIAIVAIAHFLVRVSLSLLKKGEVWEESL